MRDDRQRLRDILEAIDRIQDRTGEGREAFEDNELLQVWVIYHLQVLGEAALHVSESLRSTHPDIPWQQIIGMRHILVHGYFQTDVDIVWQVVARDLPILRSQVADLLGQ